ncbi:hypothetical protein JD844_023982 [Phrynosoma platyrhinos]|uniref:C2H2-type domain-containing protein n=1 Tax=Phrynosoma platyrhinos TaxID=52577 RepID=A0ABQ7SXE7_PHRPL|nr:hypothetical protein JD844_023982 [Phrynosoma platyrhinos]
MECVVSSKTTENTASQDEDDIEFVGETVLRPILDCIDLSSGEEDCRSSSNENVKRKDHIDYQKEKVASTLERLARHVEVEKQLKEEKNKAFKEVPSPGPSTADRSVTSTAVEGGQPILADVLELMKGVLGMIQQGAAAFASAQPTVADLYKVIQPMMASGWACGSAAGAPAMEKLDSQHAHGLQELEFIQGHSDTEEARLCVNQWLKMPGLKPGTVNSGRRAFPQKSDKISSNSKSILCPIMHCNRTFDNGHLLMGHLKRFDHSPCDPAITLHGPPANAFACIICARRFPTSQEYSDHLFSKARLLG